MQTLDGAFGTTIVTPLKYWWSGRLWKLRIGKWWPEEVMAENIKEATMVLEKGKWNGLLSWKASLWDCTFSVELKDGRKFLCEGTKDEYHLLLGATKRQSDEPKPDRSQALEVLLVPADKASPSSEVQTILRIQ